MVNAGQSSHKLNAHAKSLPDFSKSRVLVVGDLMVDRYYKGSTARISPEAPVPVVKVEELEDRPGGAANVAVNAAILGGQVTLLGFVGQDKAASNLQHSLEAHGVSCDFLVAPELATITKLRVISRQQQLIRLDFESSFSQIDKSPLEAKVQSYLSQIDVIVLSDYDKGALSDVQSLISLANHANVPILVDPKGDDFDKYRGATVITPNMGEFEKVCGKSDSESQLHSSALACCEINHLNHIVLTRSEQGMSLFSQQGNAHHMPALAREVFDVTGAGDTVVATLACGLALDLDIEFACELANHAAGVVVGKLGTSSVTATELALALNERKSIDGGVLNQEQLVVAVKQAQANKERVIMTNGCFDILHSGHVSYLQEAASLGERLVVAVNSDRSVKKLKGEGRPVNNVNRRMAVLAGLASVDWVVEFDEDTPQSLISVVLPNVLVKGGDYTIHEIAGADEVLANGGEVKTLGFEDGVSTSAIISSLTRS